MVIESPKYDVAISFLSKDEQTAAAIYQKLAGLKVFFYPRSQEELAGTDGLASMRKPFYDDSRVVVVLYRDPWGRTPWTRVEQTAIQEGCLQHGWQRLFFAVLESAGAPPIWLPTNLVRFNYADFGLEQAVGAIKARVHENGGRILPLTPAKRAEMLEAEELFRRDRSRMSSEEGLTKIVASVGVLFKHIEKGCEDINTRGSLQVRCGIDFRERNAFQQCSMTDGRVGVTVAWIQPYSNSLDRSSLIVREFSGGLILPGETGLMYLDKPTQVGETKYAPDLSNSREYGWRECDATEFMSSPVLADRCLIRFLDLASEARASTA